MIRLCQNDCGINVLKFSTCIAKFCTTIINLIQNFSMNCCLLFISSKIQHGVEWSFYLDLEKEEDRFNFKDHQCIQALLLGLKMPMVPTPYNIDRKQWKSWKKTMKIRFSKHVGIQDSDLHLFRFNRLCAFFLVGRIV